MSKSPLSICEGLSIKNPKNTMYKAYTERILYLNLFEIPRFSINILPFSIMNASPPNLKYLNPFLVYSDGFQFPYVLHGIQKLLQSFNFPIVPFRQDTHKSRPCTAYEQSVKFQFTHFFFY